MGPGGDIRDIEGEKIDDINKYRCNFRHTNRN
jgi:hypothetical protein